MPHDRNFVVWAMQRTGGTTFTTLLASMHPGPAVHEPFNGRRARGEYAEDVALAAQGRLGPNVAGKNIKHCYEYGAADFNARLFEALREAGHAMVLLERDHLARTESLALAQSTGAYGVSRASELYPRIKSGELTLDPIDIPAALKHLKRCLERTAEVRAMIGEAGFPRVSYEALFDRAPEEAEARFQRVVSRLAAAGAPLARTEEYERIRAAYFKERRQNSQTIASYIPNIEAFREAVQDHLSAAEPGLVAGPGPADASRRRVYIDLGANVGDTVARALEKERYDVVWAFEPNPSLGDGLRRRFSGSPVEVIEKAVSDRDGETRLYLGHVLSSTIVEGKTALDSHPEFAIDYERSVRVPTVDFAAWLERVLEPDDDVVVKMDVEGAEYGVLRRLLETGAIDRIRELRCEFHRDRFPVPAEQHDRVQAEAARRTTLVVWK